MAKAKKKVARNKGRSPSDVLILNLMNEAKNVNQQIHEFGSAIAMDCHNLDDVLYKVEQHFKFTRDHTNCYNARYV
jgi:hypothetical protein